MIRDMALKRISSARVGGTEPVLGKVFVPGYKCVQKTARIITNSRSQQYIVTPSHINGDPTCL
jgi:hypothetical protein